MFALNSDDTHKAGFEHDEPQGSASTFASIENSEAAIPTKKKSSVLSFLIMIVLVVLVSMGLRLFVFQPYVIPSGSMEDTIMTNDMVFSEKISFYFRSPAQGDIVTFTDPLDSSRTLIKRVIATGGQTVDLRNGVVYVDDVPLSEDYTDSKPSYPLNSNITYPYTVPEGCLWVMGDNRTSSQDSRYFGAVKESSVTGRAFFTYWPLNSIGLLQ